MTDDIHSAEDLPGGEEQKEMDTLSREEPKKDDQLDAKLKAFADLLILRFFSATPGLVSYLIDSGAVNGAVEFSFWHLPDEVILGVKKVSGCKEVEVFKFYKRGAPCTGFRFHPEEDDLDEFEIGPSDTEDKHVVKRLTSHPQANGATATTTPEPV